MHARDGRWWGVHGRARGRIVCLIKNTPILLKTHLLFRKTYVKQQKTIRDKKNQQKSAKANGISRFAFFEHVLGDWAGETDYCITLRTLIKHIQHRQISSLFIEQGVRSHVNSRCFLSC